MENKKNLAEVKLMLGTMIFIFIPNIYIIKVI